MLIEYKVSNFKSIGHEVVFSMVPDDGIEIKPDDVIELTTREGDKVNVLKKAVLFGANASGKTTLIESIEFLSGYLREDINTGKVFNIPTFKGNFKDLEGITSFDISFFSDAVIYRYELKLNSLGVVYEALSYLSNDKYNCIFNRKEKDNQIEVEGFDFFTPEERDIIPLLSKTIGNQQKAKSFLYKLHDNNVKSIEKAYAWLSGLIFVFPTSKYAVKAVRISEDENYRMSLSNYLKKYDTGIEKTYADTSMSLDDAVTRYGMPRKVVEEIYEIAKKSESSDIGNLLEFDNDLFDIRIKNGKIVVCKIRNFHKLNNNEVTLDLTEESSGTRRLFDLIPLLDIVNHANVIFVDELDRSLHTAVVKAFLYDVIVKLTNTQFIFTSHNVNLLEDNIFRFDEIWFLQKNKVGETKMCSLSEYNLPNERKKTLISDYLNGRFGGIPHIN